MRSENPPDMWQVALNAKTRRARVPSDRRVQNNGMVKGSLYGPPAREG